MKDQQLTEHDEPNRDTTAFAAGPSERIQYARSAIGIDRETPPISPEASKEVVVATSGSGMVKLADKDELLRPGVNVTVSSGVTYAIVPNAGEVLNVTVFGVESI